MHKPLQGAAIYLDRSETQEVIRESVDKLIAILETLWDWYA